MWMIYDFIWHEVICVLLCQLAYFCVCFKIFFSIPLSFYFSWNIFQLTQLIHYVYFTLTHLLLLYHCLILVTSSFISMYSLYSFYQLWQHCLLWGKLAGMFLCSFKLTKRSYYFPLSGANEAAAQLVLMCASLLFMEHKLHEISHPASNTFNGGMVEESVAEWYDIISTGVSKEDWCATIG